MTFDLTAISVDNADNASASILDCSKIDDDELNSSRASSDNSAGIKLDTLPCRSYCALAKRMA